MTSLVRSFIFPLSNQEQFHLSKCFAIYSGVYTITGLVLNQLCIEFWVFHFSIELCFFLVLSRKKVKVLVTQSRPALCEPMDYSPPGSSVHGDSRGKNTGVGCHALLQGIFQTQGSSKPWDQTQFSCITDRFFTDWVIKEAPYSNKIYKFNSIIEILYLI